MTVIKEGTLMQANFGAYDADNKYVWCDYVVKVIGFVKGPLGNTPIVQDVVTGNEFTIINLDDSIKTGIYKILGHTE